MDIGTETVIIDPRDRLADMQKQSPVQTVCAVVLTWNRKNLLTECLDAVLGQTLAVDEVIVIDNGSSDSTEAYLRERGYLDHQKIRFIRFEESRGPAFGFQESFRRAALSGYDWGWLMDDDVIPEPDALEELLSAYEKHFERQDDVAFLASRVLAPNGGSMNVPEVDRRPSDTYYPDWDRHLADGLIKIRRGTFVSVLFPRTTLCGFDLPKADFGMWGEDADYTLRATADRPAYMVASSRALHKRAVSAPPGIQYETNPHRIRMLKNLYRNEVYLARQYYSKGTLLSVVLGTILLAGRIWLEDPLKPARAWVVLSGLLAGFTFRPRSERVDIRATDALPTLSRGVRQASEFAAE